MSDTLTPIDRAALALVPLFVEARAMLAHDKADDAICNAFDALTAAADEVSYRLLRKSGWADGGAARELMVRIDDAMAELNAIERGEQADMVQDKSSKRIGRIVCATSDHADGSTRVIVEWNDGTESKVIESELQSIA